MNLFPTIDDEDEKPEVIPEGPALPQSVRVTMQLFPLATRTSTKRRCTEVPLVMDQKVVNSVLFPTEDELLGDQMDRTQLNDRPKRPRGKRVTENAMLKIFSQYMPEAVGAAAASLPLRQPIDTVQAFREHYELPNEFGVRLRSPYKLYPYQISTVQWLKALENGDYPHPKWDAQKRGGLLAMVMGLGKTLSMAVLIASTLRQQRNMQSCTLYVTQKNLLGTARFEFDKFLGSQLRVCVYNPDYQKSEYLLFDADHIRQYDVIITNYTSLVKRMLRSGLIKTRKEAKASASAATSAGSTVPAKFDHHKLVAMEFAKFPWFRVILDESHEIRNAKTQRFKALCALNAQRRFAMSGTPIFNGLQDLLSQLRFCGFSPRSAIRATEANYQKLKLDHMVRFVEQKDADTVTLPPKTVHKLFYDLNPRERFLHTFYMKTARDAFRCQSSMSGTKKSQKALEVQNRMLRLMQVCSAPYLLTPGAKQDDDGKMTDLNEDMGHVPSLVTFPEKDGIHSWVQQRDGEAGVGSSKMRALVQFWRRLNAEGPFKIVVFANFASTLRLAVRALTADDPDFADKHVCVHGGVRNARDRDNFYTRFRTNSQVMALFSTLKMGSVGLNLSEADRVLFLEPWYAYAPMRQGEGRVHRIGQINPVHVYYLLGRDTTEERVYQTAMEKKELAEDVAQIQRTSGTQRPLGSEEMTYILFNQRKLTEDEVAAAASGISIM